MSRDVVRTKTRDAVLVDSRCCTARSDDGELKTRRTILWIVVIVVVAVIALLLIRKFTMDRPVDYRAEVDHFKYGSIGSEPGGSLAPPSAGCCRRTRFSGCCRRCAPTSCLGATLARADFRAGPRPPGRRVERRIASASTRSASTARCATPARCASHRRPAGDRRRHAVSPAGSPELVPIRAGLRARRALHAGQRAGRIEEAGGDLGWLDRAAYRYAVIPRTREQTLRLSQRLALLMGDKVTRVGPRAGRHVQPVQGPAVQLAAQRLPLDELSAASDFPSLWNQKPRAGMQLHWDGNNDSVDERNLSASLGTGVTPVTIDHARLAAASRTGSGARLRRIPVCDRHGAGRARAASCTRPSASECHADHRFKEGQIRRASMDRNRGADRGDRHRSVASQLVHLRVCVEPVLALSRLPLSVHAFPQDPGLRQPAARWHLGEGALSAQRLRADAARSAGCARGRGPKRFYRGYDVFDRSKVGFVYDVA